MQQLRQTAALVRPLLVSFGCRGSQKSRQSEENWQLLVALGGACEFCRFLGRHAHESLPHFGHPFGNEIEKSGAEPVKKTRPAQQAKKSSISNVIPGGPFCCPDSKYHMFRRACPCPFEWLRGRFGVPFGLTFSQLCDQRS